MRSDVEIFDRLLQIALLIQEDLARSFAATDLTVPRTHLLWELHRLGTSTQKTLASALNVSPRNVTGLVDALEASGYVARTPHPEDRRAILVTLTELVADLDADQQERLSQGLDTIVARLQGLMGAATASGRKPSA